MRSLNKGYMQGFETPASAAALWHALVDPAALALWYGDRPVVEPRIGGRHFAVSRLFGPREAYIECFEPNVRLQLLFERNPEWPPLAEGALVEDLMIDERNGKRTLRVMGSGIPANVEWAPALKRLKSGWALTLGLLQRRLHNGDIKDPAA
jgi:uncharacterized protein YndB with AHSA1/START domain